MGTYPGSWRDSEIYGCRTGYMGEILDLWCQHGDLWVRSGSWVGGLDPGSEGDIPGLRVIFLSRIGYLWVS